ncbi:MAG: GIN domain-containing protein [Syntrophothermus sp.]
MKNSARYFLLLLFSVMIISCSKSGADCFNNSGEIILQSRIVPSFDSIDMGDYVNVIIKPSENYIATVEAGKNIVPGISTEVKGRCLYIRNNNVCNWVRDYNKPINVYVEVNNLSSISYNSSGNLTCKDTIRADIFNLDIWGGCGTIDLTFVADQGFFLYHLGSADVKLRGRINVNSVYQGDYGPMHCENLKTLYSYVINNSSNDCWIWSTEYLDATVNSIGNIYYKGYPREFITKVNGSGKVISF